MDIVKQFSIQCFVTIILTFCLIEQTNSCFIRNCPPGGKRSMDTLTRVSRQVILNNSKFGDYLERIYPIELEINDTTDTVKSASYLDLHLEFNNEGRLKTKLYDKRDDFSFPIVNFPFLSSNIPAAPAYGCMSCGPELSGQCVGPDICCGPFGCYMGTLESSICQKENESTHPCEIQGAPCGSRGQGNCVTDGICCDSGACSYNAKCKTNNMKDNQAILNVLNELLQSRDLTDK